jgi:hypothetical protein
MSSTASRPSPASPAVETATSHPENTASRPPLLVLPFVRLWQRRSFAWGRKSWWVELIVIGFGYFIYEIIQGIAPAHRGFAFANGRAVHRIQVDLHIDLDIPVNHLVNDHLWLALGTGYYYDTLHYLVTPAVLLFVYLRRPAVYGRYRSALILASMAGLVVFWALPVAPPRFVVPGIVDTLVVHHIFGTVATDGNQKLINDVAAMPSLHVGWALWCAFTIVGVFRSRWRHLAWLYPCATTFVVLGTGNHYLLDGVGGLVVVLVGFGLTRSPRPVPSSAVTDAASSGGSEELAASPAIEESASGAAEGSLDTKGSSSVSREPMASRSARVERASRREAQAPSTTTPTGISAKYTNKR